MNKFSVIVPAYNSASKICRCVNSIISQSFKDLEIILIDDASNDDTLAKMEYCASKDPRIIVFHNNKNMGAGYSRNIGIEASSGNYVTFVDSDDFLLAKTYEGVNGVIQDSSNPDIVRFKQKAFLDFDKFRINVSFFSNNIFNNLKVGLVPRDNQWYVALESPGVCNKFFSRELIDETRFPCSKWEDYPFCTFLLGKASSIQFSHNGGYIYCLPFNRGNTTFNDMSGSLDKITDIFDCCDLVEKRYKEADIFDIYKDAIRGNQKIHSLQRARDIMFSNFYSKEEKRTIINLLINLTEIKYGDVFSDPFYNFLKENNLFYRFRMDMIEHLYSESLENCKSEDDVKMKIKKMVR